MLETLVYIGFIIFWLGAALLLWAGLGHGIWLLGAAIASEVFGKPSAGAAKCPRCGHRHGMQEGRCQHCHYLASPQEQNTERDREAIVRHLRGLMAKNQITPEQYQHLQTLLQLPSVFTPPTASAPEILYLDPAIPPVTAPAEPQQHPFLPVKRSLVVASPVADTRVSLPAMNPLEFRDDRVSSTAEPPIVAEVVAELVQPTPTLIPPFAAQESPPPKMSRTMAEMIQAFLEEKNIRWGEIIAGLFIVISAVGLIISLRNTLKAIPYFPALMFMLFTVLFHGAGIYSLRKWKLNAVSRVVLVISLLLVSLSFGAGIVLSGSGEMRRPLGDPWVITAIVVSLATFSWVTWSSARELIQGHAWQLFVVVMGTAVGQIVINRCPIDQPSPGSLWGLTLLPLASFLVPLTAALTHHASVKQFSRRRAVHLLLLSGIGLFSLSVPLILLLLNAVDRREAWADLSPWLSLVIGCVLGTGLLLHCKLTAQSLSTWRTAGTSIAILACGVQLVLLAMAWPRPGTLTAVGLMDACAFFLLAVLLRIPLLHVAGVGTLTFVWMIAFPWLRGVLPIPITSIAMISALVEIPNALILAVWNAILLGTSMVLLRRKDFTQSQPRQIGRVYLFSAVGVAVLVLLLTINAGFAPWMCTNPWPVATSLLLVGNALAILLSFRLVPHVAVPAVAAGVWWLALVHVLAINPTIRSSLAPLNAYLSLHHAPTLLHAFSTAIITFLWMRPSLWLEDPAFQRYAAKARRRMMLQPLTIAAGVASCVALVLIFVPPSALYVERALELLILAATWFLLAMITRLPWAIVVTQLALHSSVAVALMGRWSAEFSLETWQFPPSLVLEQLTCASLLATAWSILRISTERLPVMQRLLRTPGFTVDALILPIVALGLFFTIAMGIAPAIGAEIGWTDLADINSTNEWFHIYHHPTAWLALGIVAAGFLIRLWERFALESLLGLGLISVALISLCASGFVYDVAAASALRWGLGGFLLVTTLLIAAREQLLAAVRGLPRWCEARLSASEIELLRYFLLVLGIAPIVVLTCATVATSLQGLPLGGPLAGSWFAKIGMHVSFGVPLLAVVASLGLYSVREHNSRFAAAAAATFQGTVILALLLYLKDAHFNTIREAAVLSLQVNAIGSAVFALVWLALDPWIERDAEKRDRFPRWIDYVVLFVTRLVVLMALWAIAAIVVSPGKIAPWDARLAGSLSFVAIALNTVVVLWRFGSGLLRYSVQGVLLLLLSLTALLALASEQWPSAFLWSGYYVLGASWLTIALAGTALAWFAEAYWAKDESEWRKHRLHRKLAWRSVGIAAFAATLAAYAWGCDPWHPWFSVAMLVVSQGCFVGQGWLLRSQIVSYLSLLFAAALGMLVWYDSTLPWLNAGASGIFHWFDSVGICIGVVGGIWLGIEIWLQRRRNEIFDGRANFVPMHQLTGGLLVVGTLLIALMAWIHTGLFQWFEVDLFHLRTLTLTFVLMSGLYLFAMLWDRRAKVIPLVYLWGGAATVFLVVAVNPPVDWLPLVLLVALAAYVACAAHLWKWGADLAGWGLRLGIDNPLPTLVQTARWLPAVSRLASFLLAAAAVQAVLTLPLREMRMTASMTPLLLAWCASSLAQPPRQQRSLLEMYLYGALAAICFGWADVTPQHSSIHALHLTIRLLMALSFTTLLYGLVVPRMIFTTGDWNITARQAAGIAGGLAILTLLIVLGQEAFLFVPGIGVPVSITQMVAISLVLVGLIVGLFSLALLPGRDPLAMNEEGRMYYVYAAQATAALLFAHLYLARPGMFDETLRPYWPYILVVLAFASVGLGEILQRSGIRVLAQPLDRTGGLLPLLPALGMWFLASQTDYSVVLFAIGALYLLHSWLKHSFTSGLAAMLAGNGALWAWLVRDEGRSFLNHPQLWLIPPAVSTLLAAHLQRRRLDPAALTAIRYAATLVIYLSSTSEMFIIGIGNSLWPPVIVALLGLAGVFAGMLLQIRPFLYMGAGFVLLALVSMVAHAARAIDHVWPWWAFGIGVGLAILILFGIFEKKRAEVMQLVDRLKQWK